MSAQPAVCDLTMRKIAELNATAMMHLAEHAKKQKKNAKSVPFLITPPLTVNALAALDCDDDNIDIMASFREIYGDHKDSTFRNTVKEYNGKFSIQVSRPVYSNLRQGDDKVSCMRYAHRARARATARFIFSLNI